MNGRCTADHTLTPPCEEARLSLYGLPPAAAAAPVGTPLRYVLFIFHFPLLTFVSRVGTLRALKLGKSHKHQDL